MNANERAVRWHAEQEAAAEELGALQAPVFETHAHLNRWNLRQELEWLLPLMRKAGIERCIVPAIEFDSANEIKKLFDGDEYDWIYYAFGAHPKRIRPREWTTNKRWAKLDALSEDPKCVAIGETGLDYSLPFDEEQKSAQKEVFERLITVANARKKPLILHIRSYSGEDKATKDALEILRTNRPEYGAVVHSFSGSKEEAKAYLDAGVTHFGIGGLVCYGIPELEDAVRALPEDRLLLETDAPYLQVNKRMAPSTSVSLLFIARKIAELRGITPERVLSLSYDNAMRLFMPGKESICDEGRPSAHCRGSERNAGNQPGGADVSARERPL